MASPQIGTVWKNKTHSDKYITIVDPSSAHVRKNIAYRYHRTGHIGGYNSSEWFYDDWEPVNTTSSNKETFTLPPINKTPSNLNLPPINTNSWWSEKSSGNVVNILSNDNIMLNFSVANNEVAYQYKVGDKNLQVFKCDKNEFCQKFQHKFG